MLLSPGTGMCSNCTWRRIVAPLPEPSTGDSTPQQKRLAFSSSGVLASLLMDGKGASQLPP